MLSQQNWWSRVANRVCCQLNTMRNEINYFTA